MTIIRRAYRAPSIPDAAAIPVPKRVISYSRSQLRFKSCSPFACEFLAESNPTKAPQRKRPHLLVQLSPATLLFSTPLPPLAPRRSPRLSHELLLLLFSPFLAQDRLLAPVSSSTREGGNWWDPLFENHFSAPSLLGNLSLAPFCSARGLKTRKKLQ